MRTDPPTVPIDSGDQPANDVESDNPASTAPPKYATGTVPASSGPARRSGAPEFLGYAVEGVLGEGGMGIVYRGRNLKLGRPVAIKTILHGLYVNQDAVDRLLNEIDVIAKLQHPHIIQILDSGLDHGLPYFVMELVESGNLGQWLAKSQPTYREAASMCLKLARAIDHAHQHGIVHRDLKPSNILLTPEGEPKITDFGIAKSAHTNRLVTQTGMVLGTPGYLSPEQAEGKTNQISPASDVFALGVILYEMITGHRPFDGVSEMEILAKIIHDDPLSPAYFRPGIPKDLETICLRCLHKKPHRRYPSAGELAEDLQRFLNNRLILARRTGRIERVAKWCRRHPAWATLAAAMALVIPAVIVGLTIANSKLSSALSRSQRLIENNSGLSEWVITKHLQDLARLNGAAQLQFELAVRLKDFLEVTRAESEERPELIHFLAKAYERVADVLGGSYGRNLGRVSEAAATYSIAIELLEQLRRESPSEDIEANYCRCMISLAGVVWLTDGMDAATKLFDQVEAVVNKKYAENPERWIGYAFVLNQNRFELAKAWNDTPKAEAILDDIDQLLSRQSDLKSESLELVKDDLPIWVAANRGAIASHKGDHEGAWHWFQQELEASRRLALADPDSESASDQLATALVHAGDELVWLEKLDEAEQHYREAESLCQNLKRRDPTNVYYMLHLAITLERLQKVLFQKEQFQASLLPAQQCIELRRQVVQIDASNLENKRGLRVALSALGDTYLQMELRTEAREPFAAALQLAEEMTALPNVDPADYEALGEASMGMGSLVFKQWLELLETETLADVLESPELKQAGMLLQQSIDAYDRITAQAPLNNSQAAKRSTASRMKKMLDETAEKLRKMYEEEIF